MQDTRLASEASPAHSRELPGAPCPLPAQDAAEEGGVETLGGREPSLHLPDRHLVLGGGAEQGEAARHRAEDLVGIRHPSDQAVFVHGQGGDGGAVRLRGDGHWETRRGEKGRRGLRCRSSGSSSVAAGSFLAASTSAASRRCKRGCRR